MAAGRLQLSSMKKPNCVTGDFEADQRVFRSLGAERIKPKTENTTIGGRKKLTVMMIGCTGRGKTTFCNFLFQEERFKSWKNKPGKRTTWRTAMSDVNQAEMSQLVDGVGGVILTVIDTPGYLATQHRCGNSGGASTSDTDVMLQEFSRALMFAKDGVDAVLVTLRCAEPPSIEEEMLLEFLTEMQIWKHCIILFTHGARVSNDGDEGYLELHSGLNSGEFAKECPVLSKFVENCERRFILIESVEKAGDKHYYRSKLDELYSAVEVTSKNAESAFNHPLLEMAKNSYQIIQMQKRLREEANDKEAQLEAIIKERDAVTTRLDDLQTAAKEKEAQLEAAIKERDAVTTRLGDLQTVAKEKEAQLEAAIKERDAVTTRLGDLQTAEKERDAITICLDDPQTATMERAPITTRLNDLQTALENDPPKVSNDASADQDAKDAAAMLLEYLRASEATDASPTRFVSAIRRLEAAERKQREMMAKLDELLEGIKAKKKKQLPCAELERELESIVTLKQVEVNASERQPGKRKENRCNLL